MNPNTTYHKIFIGASQNMKQIEDCSVELVVTSPPYPMIEMWDDILGKQNPEIKNKIKLNDGQSAFELMHQELDKVWAEVERTLVPGGFACINIGDATRSIGGEFELYSNHSRIITSFVKLGLSNLPNIIWRKQTNAPNKFMGSGMLPAGAYVTLEHEWILVFRKGGKRTFKNEVDKLNRRKSSFFWEERNSWFSDLWEIKGTKQLLNDPDTRKRSAAYPLEIPYRLINMYSLKGDTVLDPFLGTGITSIAALASERNSVGFEIDAKLSDIICSNIELIQKKQLNDLILKRLSNHNQFITARKIDPKKSEIKYFNTNIDAAVMTKQEVELELCLVEAVSKKSDNTFIATYKNLI